MLIATPEYNHSIPGALKNALDWASRPFPDNALRGKPVAVIGASTGLFGAVWAQAELRKVLTAAGADVLDSGLSVPSVATAFTLEGKLRDPRLRENYARSSASSSGGAGRATRPPDRDAERASVGGGCIDSGRAPGRGACLGVAPSARVGVWEDNRKQLAENPDAIAPPHQAIQTDGFASRCRR